MAEVENLDSYDKQLLLLNYLRTDQEVFIKTNPILLSKFFDQRLQKTVKFIQAYFNEFKALPSQHQIKAETGVVLELDMKLPDSEKKYAEQQIESFCKYKAMEHAIYDSVELMKEGRFGDVERLIKDAVTISIQRHLGTDYFEDPYARLQALKDNINMYPTGVLMLDRALGGGLNRKEMIVLAAPPGVGKSITMLNLGFNLMRQGLNVVYITLELSEEVVAKRADSIISGISQSDILKNIEKTSSIVKEAKTSSMGNIKIKRMKESTTTSNDIRAYLKEYELVNGYPPDVIIVDYIDIMASAQRGIDVNDAFTKDKYVCEELRSIADDHNAIMITASQLNRSVNQIQNLEELNQGHIAGGISKINTADNVVMIIQTDQMRAKGEMVFKLMKTRSSGGVGSYFVVNFSPITLRITNLEEHEKQYQQGNNQSSLSNIAKKVAQFKKPSGLESVFQV